MLAQEEQPSAEIFLPGSQVIARNPTINLFKRKFYRGFTISSVTLDSLYSYFLWLSIRSAVEFALNEFEVDTEGRPSTIIKYTTLPFVVANLICDLTSVDPLREADELASAANSNTSQQESSKRLLGLLLKIIAMTSSYSAGAGVDAISVANLTENMSSEKAADIINYTSLSITILLGIIYYSMLTNNQIQHHANEFIDVIKQPRAFIRNFKKFSLSYLEVAIQSLFTSAYRSVYFGYVLSDVLTTIFAINSTSRPSRASVITTAATTFLTTLFSRTLSVRDKLINPHFMFIDADSLSRATSWRPELISDGLLTLIRAGAVSVLVYNLTPGAPYVRYIAAGLVSSAVALHSGYVRYKTSLYKNALQLLPQLHLQSAINNAEESALLASTEKPFDQQGKSSIELFDEMSKHFVTRSMRGSITVLNMMMNFARFIGFFWFVAALNESLDIGLSRNEIIALTFLWGAEVFKNSMAFYDDQLRSIWSGVATKAHIEQVRDQQQLPKPSCIGYYGSFFHYAKALAKSPYDYTTEELQAAETRLDRS